MQRAPIPVREKLPAKVAPYHGTPSGFHSALRISFSTLSFSNYAKNLCAAPKLRKKLDLPVIAVFAGEEKSAVSNLPEKREPLYSFFQHLSRSSCHGRPQGQKEKLDSSCGKLAEDVRQIHI
jgi:hypothetical protein